MRKLLVLCLSVVISQTWIHLAAAASGNFFALPSDTEMQGASDAKLAPLSFTPPTGDQFQARLNLRLILLIRLALRGQARLRRKPNHDLFDFFFRPAVHIAEHIVDHFQRFVFGFEFFVSRGRAKILRSSDFLRIEQPGDPGTRAEAV